MALCSSPEEKVQGVTSPPFRIFLSYRREDSQDAAGRLYDQLAVEFGEDSVFIDVDAIPAGVDFVDHINEAVALADVFVALIGGRWLETKDESGRRRLDDESDFVRLELEAALARGIPVIPAFVQSARPLTAADLPESLAKLARIQGQALSHERWRYDSGRLIARLKEIESEKASRLGVKERPKVTESSRSQAAPPQPPRSISERPAVEGRHEKPFLLRRFGREGKWSFLQLVVLIVLVVGWLVHVVTEFSPAGWFLFGFAGILVILDRVHFEIYRRKH